MRVLGIDYGTAKIGIAIGETGTKLASPLEIVRTDDSPIDRIKYLIKQEDIGTVVVGLPLNAQSEETDQSLITWKFVQELADQLEIPVETYEERMTTLSAKKLMQSGGMKGEDDAIAAMVMLQSYFDSLK